MISRQRQYLSISSSRACGPGYVCCSQRQPSRKPRPGQCGVRYTQGINGRIKTPSYVDGDSEFGEKLTSISLLFRSLHSRMARKNRANFVSVDFLIFMLFDSTFPRLSRETDNRI